MVELTIPANHILYFSTHLLHRGWELESESSTTFRYHYLFLGAVVHHQPMDAVWMHQRPYAENEDEFNRTDYFYALLRYFADLP